MASLSGHSNIAWRHRLLKMPTQLLLLGSSKEGSLVFIICLHFLQVFFIWNAMEVWSEIGECRMYIWWSGEDYLKGLLRFSWLFLGTLLFVLVLGDWEFLVWEDSRGFLFPDEKLIVRRMFRWNSKMVNALEILVFFQLMFLQWWLITSCSFCLFRFQVKTRAKHWLFKQVQLLL